VERAGLAGLAAADDRDGSAAERRVEPGRTLQAELREVDAGDAHALAILYWSDVQCAMDPYDAVRSLA
jgi:hypothetical protein